jgi:hypothetical protein
MPIERGLQYLRQMQRITLKNLPMPLEKTEKWKKEHVRIYFILRNYFFFSFDFLAG